MDFIQYTNVGSNLRVVCSKKCHTGAANQKEAYMKLSKFLNSYFFLFIDKILSCVSLPCNLLALGNKSRDLLKLNNWVGRGRVVTF